MLYSTKGEDRVSLAVPDTGVKVKSEAVPLPATGATSPVNELIVTGNKTF